MPSAECCKNHGIEATIEASVTPCCKKIRRENGVVGSIVFFQFGQQS